MRARRSRARVQRGHSDGKSDVFRRRMAVPLIIRDFQKSESVQVNALALRAFEQFRDVYLEWPQFQQRIGNMAALSDAGAIIVAEVAGKLVGAVAYIAPGVPKADYFRPEWPIMRMRVVDPDARGGGIGRTLAEECIRRAERDGAKQFALHTSEIMAVALPMYLRMGFQRVSVAPPIHGVEYCVYLKTLGGEQTS